MEDQSLSGTSPPDPELWLPENENQAFSDHDVRIVFGMAGVLLFCGICLRFFTSPYVLSKFMFVTPIYELYFAPNFRTASTALGILPAINLFFLGGVMVDYDTAAAVGTLVAILLLVVSTVMVFLNARSARKKPGAMPEKFLTATNLYEDFSRDPVQAILMGLSQLLLLIAYMWGIYDNGQPTFGQGREYVYYGVGIIVQIGYVYGKGCAIGLDPDDFWVKAFTASQLKGNLSHYYLLSFTNLRKPGDSHIDIDGRGVTFCKSRAQMWIRFLFSKVVNTSGLFLIYALLPFQLASSADPVDFILTAVAAFFIIEIDDQDDAHFGNHAIMYPEKRPHPQKQRVFLPLSSHTTSDFIVNFDGSNGRKGSYCLMIELNTTDSTDVLFKLVETPRGSSIAGNTAITDESDADTEEFDPTKSPHPL